jgi:hypothetical protein
MAPTKIISRKKKKCADGVHRYYHYLCDDGLEYISAEIMSINCSIMEQWRIKVGLGRDYASRKPAKFDRGRCKRNSLLCTNYSECQSIRLGLTGEEWEDPGDTDACYEEGKVIQNLFTSSLADPF